MYCTVTLPVALGHLWRSLIPGAVIDQVIPENDLLGQNTAPTVRQKKKDKQTNNQKQQKTRRQIHKTYTKIHQTTRNHGGHLFFYLLILFRN